MLLRSLTKHVKDQNWFAVALDFFIVVVGILIAFQITEWNDSRGDRAAEAKYLVALEQDVVASLAEIELVETIHDEQEKARQFLYRYSLSEAQSLAPDLWPDLINKALWSGQSLEISNTTFESLRSSGKLDVFADPDLVAALQELSVLLSNEQSMHLSEGSIMEKYGDSFLYEHMDLGAVFQLRSMRDKDRIYVPWVKEASKSFGTPEALKTQQFRNALLMRSALITERSMNFEELKDQYVAIQNLIENRKKEIGVH